MADKEKPWNATQASTPDVLDQDIHAVLSGAFPRKVGEMPAELGEYERIAPSPMYDQISKFRRQPRASKAKCSDA